MPRLNETISNPTYDASWIKEPVFKELNSVKKYEEAFNALQHGKIYHSNSAERKRFYSIQKRIKIFDQYQDQIFESVVISFLHNIDPKLKYKKLNKIKYIKSKSSKEINRIESFVENEIFELSFIKIDIVYMVRFAIKRIGKQTYLIVYQSMKSPFTMDIWSLKSVIGKNDFKRRFKWFVKNIESGLTSLDEITMIKERVKK